MSAHVLECAFLYLCVCVYVCTLVIWVWAARFVSHVARWMQVGKIMS